MKPNFPEEGTLAREIIDRGAMHGAHDVAPVDWLTNRGLDYEEFATAVSYIEWAFTQLAGVGDMGTGMIMGFMLGWDMAIDRRDEEDLAGVGVEG